MVKGAVAAKQRDVRILELTTSEVNHLPKDTKLYEGVGKMYVCCPSFCEPKLTSTHKVRLQSIGRDGEATIVGDQRIEVGDFEPQQEVALSRNHA